MTDIQAQLDALQAEVQQLRQKRTRGHRLSRFGLPLLALVVASGVALAVGVAHATIPGAGGVISACYQDRNGALRVIDADLNKCDAAERMLTWNMAGATGPTGPSGNSGISGYTVVQGGSGSTTLGVASATVNCPAGKRALGGGGSASYMGTPFPPNYPILQSSLPSGSSGTGWQVTFATGSTYTAQITTIATAYAICATVAS
jgi:hypothetical protein